MPIDGYSSLTRVALSKRNIMKKNIPATLFLCSIFSLLLVSCNSPAAPATQIDVVAPSPAPQSAPTGTPAPTATKMPTATPEPIPCSIAFDSDRDSNLEVYRMAPDGSDPINLTNNPGDDFDPAWSPDGSQIAFVSNRVNDQEGGLFIYVMDADGSHARQLTIENESKSPDWSKDGRQVTYSHKGDIYIIAADGTGQSINLTNSPEEDGQPTWSPDSSQIAWLLGNPGSQNVFVMNADGSDMRQITDNGRVGNVDWTIDGRLLTGWGWKDQQEFCHNCIVNVDGSQVMDAGGKGDFEHLTPFWTLDGIMVGVANVDVFTGDKEIYLVSKSFPDPEGLGAGFVNLTNNPAGDRNPDWPANCGPGSNASQMVAAPEPTPQPQSPQEIVIGYEAAENNMSAQKEADLLKACEELQIECIKSDNIATLAEQNVDAIVSFSSRWHAMESYPAFHDIVSKGIVLIVLNAEAGEPGAYNLSIDSDSVRSSLEWMFKEMGDVGEFAYFNYGQNEFHQSIIDQALKDHSGIQATSMPADFKGNVITEARISSLVTSNPNLKGIWTDERLNDVFWGLKNGKVEPLPAILCEPKSDNLQFWKDWTNENPAFRCFSTIKPGGTGYEGVYVAFYLLTGEEIDPAALGGELGNTLIYDYPTITNDNLDEWLGKIGSFRKGDWDILEMPPLTPDEIKEKWFLE
jgi:ABC-type sugar transport system substrate-binding protein